LTEYEAQLHQWYLSLPDYLHCDPNSRGTSVPQVFFPSCPLLGLHFTSLSGLVSSSISNSANIGLTELLASQIGRGVYVIRSAPTHYLITSKAAKMLRVIH